MTDAQKTRIILVDDSRLVALSWKLQLADQVDLLVFRSPSELLESLKDLSINAQEIFVLDFDYGAQDSMNGIELAQALRARGLTSRLYLYTGFTEGISNDHIESGLITGLLPKEITPVDCLKIMQAQG